MDDPKNAESLLTLWKDWDNGDLSVHKDLFADSMSMTFADGSMMHASRDSALAAAQKMRNNFASAVSSVDAIMAVKSTDKNENWAIIWGKEVDTDKKGKVDSTYLQETWRFNKDGKTDLMFQYKQAIHPPKK
jgi:ketosteroid isomerase-like protein